MDEEAKLLRSSVKHMLQQGLDTMDAASAALLPLSGGQEDGTLWSNNYKEGSDIIIYFCETLDKVNPGQMDKLNKQLDKATHG